MSRISAYLKGTFHSAFICHIPYHLQTKLRLNGDLVKSQWAYFGPLKLYKLNQVYPYASEGTLKILEEGTC